MGLADIWEAIKSYILVKSATIDNPFFSLHRKHTVMFTFLLASWMLMMSWLKVMNCVGDTNSISQDVWDSYCFVHSTYVVKNKMDGVIGREVIAPGVGQLSSISDEVLYYTFYKWATILMYIQAQTFHLPFYIWKLYEGSRISMMTQNLQTGFLAGAQDVDNRKKLLVNYLYSTFFYNNSYYGMFCICELMNMINVVFQFWILDCIFGGLFLEYGFRALAESVALTQSSFSYMHYVFPKLTKCTLNKYGPSGNIVPHDALCILPLNIYYEKLYLFLWLWLMFLAFVSVIAEIYRLSTFFSFKLRYIIILQKAPACNRTKLKYLLEKGFFGDWFLLSMTGKNLDFILFSEIIDKLSDKLAGDGNEEGQGCSFIGCGGDVRVPQNQMGLTIPGVSRLTPTPHSRNFSMQSPRAFNSNQFNEMS